MADRRSSRARKEIDYSKFGRSGDDDAPFIEHDDDDDFAEPTPPPSKRAKKEKAKKSERRQEKKHEMPAASKARPAPKPRTVEDKVFDQELQLALEMSAMEGDPPVLEHVALVQPGYSPPGRSPPPLQLEEKENTAMVAVGESNVVAANDSSIEELETNVQKFPVPGRKRAPVKRYIESDEEESEDEQYVAQDESSEDSESDFHPEDDDSDFDSKKKKKKPALKKNSPKKPVTKATKSAPLKMTIRLSEPKPVSKPLKPLKPSNALKVSSVSKTSSPLVRSSPSVPPSSLHSPGLRKWNPPAANNLGSAAISSIKSPSSGLRLGLSRRSRIKPLHANVKVPH